MWMWTLDERLINVALIESVELYPNIPEDADIEAFMEGEIDADYFEIVAVMVSGDEAVLYECEEEEQGQLAYSLLAATLAIASGGETKVDAPFSVQDLLDEHRKQSN